MADSFGTRRTLETDSGTFAYFSLPALSARFPNVARLPYCHKVLLENLLRNEDGVSVSPAEIEALATGSRASGGVAEIAFTPARVLLQDFTGVPAIVDLAAMRDAMRRMGGDPTRINPIQPVELVIDHSFQVDTYGSKLALTNNARLEYERNAERYRFLKWGQRAFQNFRVVPPQTGIVHQVNLEFLARVVMQRDGVAYPDTVVGTDSHTTMVNGLGVLGWGVGGIEAEASMLGQPVSMLIPEVLGVRLTGSLPEGTTATDLVLTVTETLRAHGVVGKFVEFFGPGLAALPLADRATLANMAPEYGATIGIFPVDAETLRYLSFSGRDAKHVALVEAYYRAQGLFADATAEEASYSEVIDISLATIEACMAGPSRPEQRVPLAQVPASFEAGLLAQRKRAPEAPAKRVLPIAHMDGVDHVLADGSVVLAAITSCTNTSNPSVLLAAGLLAKKAALRGLARKPWVKTSLSPGSKVVTEYLAKAGLLPHLEALGFHVVGYGCATCIGNSGPLEPAVSRAVAEGDLVVASVLSGNRNFEGRVHGEVRANYLASPPLVVAYALAGRIDIDWKRDPIGTATDGTSVFLADLWPSQHEIADAMAHSLSPDMFRRVYADVFSGDETWNDIRVDGGDQFAWDEASHYVKHPPYFEGMTSRPLPASDVVGARCLAWLGDSITTDHISPAGSIKASSPAGTYLEERGVRPAHFNQYGARRGNHEVMVRGTFANIRLRNRLTSGIEGGVTRHLPSGEIMSIFDASLRYADENVPLVILAGKAYGSGSSRDWAAKGPKLLGIRAVIAESYERIHRSNLVGMGILPVEFPPGVNASSLGLTGEETFDLVGVPQALAATGPKVVRVVCKERGQTKAAFDGRLRIDTPKEVAYYEHGGILPYVLRQLLKA